MSSVEISYYQGEIFFKKCWLPPAIKQKLEDMRQTKKDRDQIYVEETKLCAELTEKWAKAEFAEKH